MQKILLWLQTESCLFFTLSNSKHGETIVIGLAASSTSKGPQVKTTEPMVWIKVTNCSIQLGWILARDGFAKNICGLAQRPKSAIFSFSACGWMDEWMDGWMDVQHAFVFFVYDFFHIVEPIGWNWKPTIMND